MAVGGAIYGVVQPAIASFMTGAPFVLDWTYVWHVALGAAGVYITKELLTPIPKAVAVDPAKTAVVDVTNKDVISETITAPAPKP